MRKLAASILLATVLLTGRVWASTRLIRHFDQANGLPVSSVSALAQDGDGFLWIGTNGGLVRWDGREMRPWGRDVTIGLISLLVQGPSGELIAGEHPFDSLYRVTEGGLEPIAGPDGRPIQGVSAAAFSPAGELWVIQEARLLRRTASGWGPPSPDLPQDERPYGFGATMGDGLLLITQRGVRQLNGGSVRELVVEMGRVRTAVHQPDGSLFLVQSEYPVRLIRIRNGERTELASVFGRGKDLVIRDGTVWMVSTRNLVAARPGGRIDVIEPNDDFARTGGPALVDREGSLWLGNFRGLYQFPEPDTVVWTAEDGLPTEHTRFLESAGEEIWASTWEGLARFTPAGRWESFFDSHAEAARKNVCADRFGRLWIPATLIDDAGRDVGQEIVGLGDGPILRYEYPLDDHFGKCSTAPDGTVLLPDRERILRTDREGGRPQVVARLPDKESFPHYAMEDHQGRLWAGGIGWVCHADVQAAGSSTSWICEDLPGQHQMKSLVPTPSGTVWAATSGGIFRRRDDRWERIRASVELNSSWMLNLQLAAEEGIWIVGHGTLLRVAERPETEAGWEVLEQPGFWQGIPTGGGEDVLEADDGTLWVTTSAGVIQVPPGARDARPKPPSVRLVDVTVDGVRLPLDGRPDLPYDRNRMELRFAALTYRDRSLVRYRIRSSPDADWVESRQPGFRFFDLPPGDYQPEVIASLDGVNWSAEPARFAFTIRPPWYRQTWALALFAMLSGALLYGMYRIRLGILLRLERQRTRIAMDLHDELGAGLGSIGLLADLVADEQIEQRERRHLTGKISDAAEELGGGLTDIIWSLRGRSEHIEALGVYIRERGKRLIPGGGISFSTRFPELWPDVKVSLTVRRNLQRIAIEALHNVVKHSEASNVELGLAQVGGRWRLSVEDDGRGMPENPVSPEGRGLGLESMRRRAEEIGAEIRWMPGRCRGTRLELVFDPQRHLWRRSGRSRG
jgi:signal transduction histidine kinase/ligand-binding sensor domain-containing protein